MLRNVEMSESRWLGSASSNSKRILATRSPLVIALAMTAAPVLAQQYDGDSDPAAEAVTARLNTQVAAENEAAAAAEGRALIEYEAALAAHADAVADREAAAAARERAINDAEAAHAADMAAWRVRVAACDAGDQAACGAPPPPPY